MINILTVGSGGYRIIQLAQDGAFWIGIIMVIYGLTEAMMGYPNWKKRLFTVVMSYIAILVVPIVFLEIKNSLQPEMRRQFIRAQEEVEQEVGSTNSINQDDIDRMINDINRNNENLTEEDIRQIVIEVLENER